MEYKCRVTKPNMGEWVVVKANTPEEAANEFHYSNSRYEAITYLPPLNEGGETIYFATIEIDGHGEFVARSFYSGIGRRGGVTRPRITLRKIAEILGWEKDPQELIEPGWEYEETIEEAWAASRQRTADYVKMANGE